MSAIPASVSTILKKDFFPSSIWKIWYFKLIYEKKKRKKKIIIESGELEVHK